jgi:hypothetical protein
MAHAHPFQISHARPPCLLDYMRQGCSAPHPSRRLERNKVVRLRRFLPSHQKRQSPLTPYWAGPRHPLRIGRGRRGEVAAIEVEFGRLVVHLGLQLRVLHQPCFTVQRRRVPHAHTARKTPPHRCDGVLA